MGKIAILIPGYNESQTIEKVVKDYKAAFPVLPNWLSASIPNTYCVWHFRRYWITFKCYWNNITSYC